MTIKIAINGLGRIGKCIVRAVLEGHAKDIEIVAVNSSGSISDYITLLKYDSIHGRLPYEFKVSGDVLSVQNQNIKFLSFKDPALIPWETTGAEIILECSGKFNSRADAKKHLRGNVKHVIISAPSNDADYTIVYGVNNDGLKVDHSIISAGSCTTNALAPIAQIMHDSFGIESGYMTTIHAYTNDQNLIDNRHKDERRARAAAMSMIPTSTGAAKTIGKIIPELEGKLSGSAIRVPVPNVSMIDLVFKSAKNTSKEEVNKAVQNAAQTHMREILSVAETKLVSIDFNHDSSSSIFDPFETQVTQGNLVRVVSWYDNEWGFTNRMLDIAKLVYKLSAQDAPKA